MKLAPPKNKNNNNNKTHNNQQKQKQKAKNKTKTQKDTPLTHTHTLKTKQNRWDDIIKTDQYGTKSLLAADIFRHSQTFSLKINLIAH